MVDENSGILLATTTDTTGEYEFGDILPGTYVVEEQNPADLIDVTDSYGDATKGIDFISQDGDGLDLKTAIVPKTVVSETTLMVHLIVTTRLIKWAILSTMRSLSVMFESLY